MNKGKPVEHVEEKELKRAKREMLGLQTLPNPERPCQADPDHPAGNRSQNVSAFRRDWSSQCCLRWGLRSPGHGTAGSIDQIGRRPSKSERSKAPVVCVCTAFPGIPVESVRGCNADIPVGKLGAFPGSLRGLESLRNWPARKPAVRCADLHALRPIHSYCPSMALSAFALVIFRVMR